jgi:hypothetical protein
MRYGTTRAPSLASFEAFLVEGGPPIIEESAKYIATISSYRSTLTVSAVLKGTPPEVLTIDGTSTSYEGNPPIGGWTTPALDYAHKGSIPTRPGAR